LEETVDKVTMVEQYPVAQEPRMKAMTRNSKWNYINLQR
jgi:hypothetical protein